MSPIVLIGGIAVLRYREEKYRGNIAVWRSSGCTSDLCAVPLS